MVLSAAKWTRSESPCVAGSCEEFFKHSLAFNSIIARDCGFPRAAPVFGAFDFHLGFFQCLPSSQRLISALQLH